MLIITDMSKQSMKRSFMFFAASVLLLSCQESMEERAAREAREVTETKCPMPVADNLYLDSVVFDIPTLTQSQYFRVTGELDNDSLFEVTDSRSLLLNELKNAPTYRTLMKHGVNFRYIYHSTKSPSKVMLELTLTPEDYRQ